VSEDLTSADRPKGSIEVFVSYAHEDRNLRDELEEALAVLKREGAITVWDDRQILGGQPWKKDINLHVSTADVILLLISNSFLASQYCYDEMLEALERHKIGKACVIPVILRPVDGWDRLPIGELNALPRFGKAVTEWENRDLAFRDVAEGIRGAAESLFIPNRMNRLGQVSSPALRITQPDPKWDDLVRILDTRYRDELEYADLRRLVGAIQSKLLCQYPGYDDLDAADWQEGILALIQFSSLKFLNTLLENLVAQMRHLLADSFLAAAMKYYAQRRWYEINTLAKLALLLEPDSPDARQLEAESAQALAMRRR
jgi:hypothetical protein